jgi:hypothetical protein
VEKASIRCQHGPCIYAGRKVSQIVGGSAEAATELIHSLPPGNTPAVATDDPPEKRLV